MITKKKKYKKNFLINGFSITELIKASEKARAGDLEVYKAENFQSRAYETRLLSFAHFLRYERESRGMSVETVCDWAEVDVKRWLAWETERALPDQLEVECLAFRLFCSQVKQKEMISAWKSGVMGQAA